MRRGWLFWILAIAAGIAIVLVVTAAIGHRDKRGETVPAGDWAQSVCSTVATWRGDMEGIINEVRQAPYKGATGTEEPQSQTPQGRTGFVREGLKRSVEATKTLVKGIDNAGVPDTPQGEGAAGKVSEWADSSVTKLEDAEDSLHEEAGTLEEAVTQYTGAAGAVGSTLANGVATFAEVARLDPQLAAAFKQSSTCQRLREEESST